MDAEVSTKTRRNAIRETRAGAKRQAVAAVLVIAVACAAAIAPAAHGAPSPVLHEPIPPNPGEDLAMHVVLDGNLPAAIQTPRGPVEAPDPQALPGDSDATYGTASNQDQFRPDRDTSRPRVNGYDDPFVPGTAPFKRLSAFDGVREDYTLYVREGQLVPLSLGSAPASADDVFYADAVVDLSSGEHVRVPSIGPGARIVRAHLGVGSQDVPFRIVRDGADNWFLEATGGRIAPRASDARARLVMELTIARATFGGPIGDPSWNDLPFVARLPDNVARDAAVVAGAIGVSRRMRPQRAIAALVRYFREFVDSPESPHAHGNVYLDLALSKKGVCRHRAFAFLVTAQSLGIPTRMITNEAHAWVEIHDGTLWRRIDLGGAGEFEDASVTATDRLRYEPAPEPFDWPAGADRADRGDGMIERAAARATNSPGAPRSAVASAPSASDPGVPPAPPRNDAASASEGAERERALEALAGEAPPTSRVTLTLVDGADVHRGLPLRLRGQVHAAGEPCAAIAVDVSLRDTTTRRRLYIGSLATDDDGVFVGSLVVPSSFVLGDYDVVASTAGDTRCGASPR
ncbi:MAG TPA: transglutaminase domain-containing protein [Polyangiaceae bacterium]|nr:transglutaminase domain-containing protein [Polyangiaceae bacterium]